VGIYGPQSVFRIVWDGRKQFKRLGDRTGIMTGLRMYGIQLFSVKHAVWCYVYLNSQE